MAQTLSEAIGADHDAFDVFHDKIKASTTDEDKIKWRNQLTWTVARHAISEELTWYPAMSQYLGEEGAKLAQEDKEQHAAVKKELAHFQSLHPSSPSFGPTLEALMENLHHHVEHEKNEDMPRLEKLLSRQESEMWAKRFQATKTIAPTQAHPWMPEGEYGGRAEEGLASLLNAPIDRFRDLFKSWPDQEEVHRDTKL